MSELPAAYAHVLGLGLLWTSVHCASMCGPLLCGLQVGGRGAFGVLKYQAGRALTYSWLGGLAGLVGAGLSRLFTAAGGVLALGFGVALLLATLRPRNRLLQLGRKEAGLSAQAIARLRGLLAPLLLSTHPLRELVLGALLGFLPCMIPAWALGQAALTGSPLHGAVVMLLLVLLTTPVLLVTTQLPRLGLVLPQPLRRVLTRWLPAVSGVWLLLIGGAGLGLWSHAHFGFTLLGRGFMMMVF